VRGDIAHAVAHALPKPRAWEFMQRTAYPVSMTPVRTRIPLRAARFHDDAGSQTAVQSKPFDWHYFNLARQKASSF